MITLNKNNKISLYGNLYIDELSQNIEESICISIENKKISKIGDYLYNILNKQYEKYVYSWNDMQKEIKTTKVVIDEKNIKCKSINIYGYVEIRVGIPSEDGKKYKFSITDIKKEDLLKKLELLYDEYIYEFDTIKEGLKFVIEKMEIYD